jgi:hypothetical protein
MVALTPFLQGFVAGLVTWAVSAFLCFILAIIYDSDLLEIDSERLRRFGWHAPRIAVSRTIVLWLLSQAIVFLIAWRGIRYSSSLVLLACWPVVASSCIGLLRDGERSEGHKESLLFHMAGGTILSIWIGYGFYDLLDFEWEKVISVYCANLGGSIPWLISLFYFSRRFDRRNCDQFQKKTEDKETELRQKKEAAEIQQNELHKVQKQVAIRSDGLVDLRLFKLVEVHLGIVDWSKVESLPRFVRWFETPPNLLPVKLKLSRQFQEGAVSEVYSREHASHDARALYLPSRPLFIAKWNKLEESLNAQINDLLFVARILKVAAAALKQPAVVGTGDLSDSDVSDVFRGVFEMGRKTADTFLANVEKRIADYEQERRAKEARKEAEREAIEAELRAEETLRESQRRAATSARLVIMDGVHELFEKHGEFLPHEHLVGRIDKWLMVNTGGEINPQTCLDKLERIAIVFHSQRLLNELGNGTSDVSRAILRERVSESRPLEELRLLFQEIQRLVATCPAPKMSAEEAAVEERKLKEWLDQFNRSCDETTVDVVQRGLAKEKFYNTQYLPAMQDLSRRRAGL